MCVCVCVVQMGLILVLSMMPPTAALILIKGKKDMEAFSQRDWSNQPHTFTWTNTFELDPPKCPFMDMLGLHMSLHQFLFSAKKINSIGKSLEHILIEFHIEVGNQFGSKFQR